MENSPVSSKSQENLSNNLILPESRTNLKQKPKKDKYHYVESKVKLYRQEIQNEQKLRKEIRLKGSQNCITFTKEDSETDEESCDDIEIVKEKLKQVKKQLKVVKKTLEDKERLIACINEQLTEFRIKDGENQVKCDYMRVEITRLKSMLPNENPSQMKSGTPLSIRYISQFSVFKTPIRSISKTLLSPFKSITKSNAEAAESDDSSLEENEDNNAGLDNKTFVIKDNNLAPNDNRKDISINSNEPLMNKSRIKTNSRKLMTNLIGCLNCTRSEETCDLQLPTIRINNRVYPDIDVSCLHSPKGSFKRTVSLDDSSNVKIPTVTIHTPPPNKLIKNSELNLRLSV